VGCYPQPGWLADADSVSARVPRVCVEEIWRGDSPRGSVN
jgi:hypothetical protein